jgi:putative ABC transport system permease protein
MLNLDKATMIGELIVANVLHRPVRTAVTVLAVGIEIVLVMVVVGLTTGMLRDSARRVEGVGADIMVQPPGSSFFLGLSAAPMSVKLAGLIDQIRHVQQAAPVLLEFNPGSGGLNVIYGIDIKTFDSVSGGFTYLSGGPFRNTWDILVDNTYARSENVKVGDTLDLLNHKFHVCGVVEHGKGGRLFMPIAAVQQIMGAAGHANLFFVKCTERSYTSTVLAGIRKLLPGYKVISVREYMSMMTANNIPALTDFVRVIIAIALSVGFLVIFLAMYTATTERTREIGIMKSLGASKMYLVRAFLQEAGLLAGGGLAVGYAGTYLLTRFVLAYVPTLTIHLTVGWAVRAGLLALVGALIGAFYPALRAASLDPLDALGYE